MIDIEREDFIIFLSDFSNDSIFQKERISEEFIECEIAIEGDSLCYELQLKDWLYLNLIPENKIQLIYDNFNLIKHDTDERVFVLTRVESNSATFYYFRRQKNGKWFLIRRVIYL